MKLTRRNILKALGIGAAVSVSGASFSLELLKPASKNNFDSDAMNKVAKAFLEKFEAHSFTENSDVITFRRPTAYGQSSNMLTVKRFI
jgi:hypothetical protein